MRQQKGNAPGSFAQEYWKKQLNDFTKKKIVRTKFDKNLEHHMAHIRMVDGLKKIDITDILYDGDKMFGHTFTPW
jgi:hypothetical protein